MKIRLVKVYLSECDSCSMQRYAVLTLSLSVTSSTLLRVGRNPVRVIGPLGLAPEGVVRSSAGTLISIE